MSSISPGPKHPCAPASSFGAQAFGKPSPQDSGVPVSYFSRTQEFPVLSHRQAFPTRRIPSLITWLWGGLWARRVAGRVAQRGGPIDPGAGRAALRAGRGARLSAPTAASRTWRRGDSLEGGAGLPEPRPPSPRPAPAPPAFSVLPGPQRWGFGPLPPEQEPRSRGGGHRNPSTIPRPQWKERAPGSSKRTRGLGNFF